jgi:hypothetical protein
LFSFCSAAKLGAMPDEKPLIPATREELATALKYALGHGRTGKAHRYAHDSMTSIAAEVLVEHLELSGFVVMKRPPGPMHTAPPPFGPDRPLTD